MSESRIVAVALLTQDEVTLLGPTFQRLWVVDETPFFGALLSAIDDADRALSHERDRVEALERKRSEAPVLIQDGPGKI